MFYVKCVPLPELKKYELVESTIIEGYEVTAPYRWNGASIPDFLWPIIGSPFDPRYMAPSLIHDHGYEYGTLPREDLDKLFKKLLIPLSGLLTPKKIWRFEVPKSKSISTTLLPFLRSKCQGRR